MSLDNVKLRHSTLTDTIYLCRFGKKDPGLALEKRPAESDVFAVLIEHMTHDAPKGSTKVVHFGDQGYEITVKPL